MGMQAQEHLMPPHAFVLPRSGVLSYIYRPKACRNWERQVRMTDRIQTSPSLIIHDDDIILDFSICTNTSY